MEPVNHSTVLKILCVGDACVGKTSFVQRYVNGTFSRSYKGTIGVDFALKIVDWSEEEKLKVQLWDIAGQERFSYMTRVYYKDAHGCIIMFDVTNRSSFLNVVKWKRDFDQKLTTSNGTEVPTLLLANKADMRQLRQVTKEEVEKMCREYNFTGWAEVSVKDNLMVADAMMFLLENIMRTRTRSNEDFQQNTRQLESLRLKPMDDQKAQRQSQCQFCS